MCGRGMDPSPSTTHTTQLLQMTTLELSSAVAFYRKSALSDLISKHKSLGMNPLEDELLVQGFEMMMKQEYGAQASAFHAEDFFAGVE